MPVRRKGAYGAIWVSATDTHNHNFYNNDVVVDADKIKPSYDDAKQQMRSENTLIVVVVVVCLL